MKIAKRFCRLAIVLGMAGQSAAALAAEGASYHVDPEKGADSAAGTSAAPFKTIAKALSDCKGGETILLASGKYGILTESAPPAGRSNWVTIKAENGAAPILDKLVVKYATTGDAWLRFEGISIKPPWVDPGADPQRPESRSDTYKKAGYPATLENVGKFVFDSGKIEGTNKYLTQDGFSIDHCTDVTISNTEIFKCEVGMKIGNSKKVTVSGCHIHELSSSGIKALEYNEDLLIEWTHIHDGTYSEKDDYAPRAAGQTPHASAISIRTANITLRHNMLHDIGSSSGIMFYEPHTAAGKLDTDRTFSNIHIEDNLFFDIPNPGVVRLYLVGKDVFICNNTIVGRVRDVQQAQYRLNSALVVSDFAKGHDGSGLHVYNNILLGACILPATSDVKGNLMWSFTKMGEKKFATEALPGNVLLCKTNTQGFEALEGLFAGGWPPTAKGKALPDFHLKPGSPALNLGMPENQTPASLGSLDDRGFLIKDGVLRNAEHHSAGCYELKP